MFPCQVPDCKIQFPSELRLHKHRIDVHPGHCHLCQQSFASKSTRDGHAIIAHDIIPCDECNCFTRSVPAHMSHYLQVHSFECPICNGKWSIQENLDEHIQLCHKHKCNFCEQVFDTSEERVDHQHTMHCITCDLCKMTFATEQQREDHDNKEHNNFCKQFQCGICTKLFQTDVLLTEHYQVHQLKCFLCSDIFLSGSEREEHFKVVHNFNCVLCTEAFVSKDLRDEHFNIIHQLKCELCEKISTTESSLRMHYFFAHKIKAQEIDESINKSKEFCSVCSEAFDTEEKLIEHYQNLHIN